MSNARPNVDIVKQLYAAFKDRNLPAIFSLLAADVQILQSTEVPWGGTYRGHNGAQQFFAALANAIDSTLVLERFIDAGDHVVAIGRTQGTVKVTGARYDVPIAHVWEVNDGKVSAARFYIDNPTMLAAL